MTEVAGPRPQPNDPLHGITLETLLTELVAYYGWDELGTRIKVNCFIDTPSVKSSLKFLRKTPWARTKVENLYLKMRSTQRPSMDVSINVPMNVPMNVSVDDGNNETQARSSQQNVTAQATGPIETTASETSTHETSTQETPTQETPTKETTT